MAGRISSCVFPLVLRGFAQALSPPKKICAVDKTSGSFLLAVSCKPGGKLKFASSSMTSYLLTGFMVAGVPVVGSGYVTSSDIFYSVLTGGHVLAVYLNLATEEGTYDFFAFGGGSPISGEFKLINCLELP